MPMPATSDVLTMLLHLGERIAEAIEDEEWSRVSGLVEERSDVAHRLQFVEPDDFSRSREKKIDALDDQNDRLMTLLHERRDQIEDKLTRIERLRHAQDSYENSPSGEGILPPELSG